MKLRSGRALPARIDRLPEDLDNLLDMRLHEFKTLFSGNPQHAKELLHMIGGSYSISCRHPIVEKIGEIYNTNSSTTEPLIRKAGELMTLIVYSPECHEIIAKRMDNFDLEADLIGDIGE
jgi:hypothetical protein